MWFDVFVVRAGNGENPGTLVCFHAHPDDETILTGGTIARAAADGHRVVVVFATRGELGENLDGIERSPDTLGAYRVTEAERAAEILGAARVAFLDYHDSGMAGEPTNAAAGAFSAANREDAAEHLAALLREEHAEVVTTYDERGGYEHPDHVVVHHVGVRAAELAGTPRVYLATVSRQHFEEMSERHLADPDGPPPPAPDVELGVDEARITTVVDVRPVLKRKRAAMAAHATQIAESSFFLSLPADAFAEVFGTEWFIRLDADPGHREDWIF
ncbi:MAG: PIG-L family deacetylase [Acidimicrobiia bacterium]